ncbi:hypothetical protein [Pseudorhodoferax sp.]|uniref:hypothetical protein n=1 Tax=Pseudorhodoferax sp. TaxID=1993553 RepID=UPI0039E3C852
MSTARRPYIEERLEQLERSNEELVGLVTALSAVTTALAATHPQRAVLLEALARAAPGVREATQAHGLSERTQLVLETYTNLLHQTLTEPEPAELDEANQVIQAILQNPSDDEPRDCE